MPATELGSGVVNKAVGDGVAAKVAPIIAENGDSEVPDWVNPGATLSSENEKLRFELFVKSK